MEANSQGMSVYFRENLTQKPAAKKRYLEKIEKCKLPKDPYAYNLKEFDQQPAVIPQIRSCDLTMYMVHSVSQYTREETKVTFYIIN